MTEKGGGSDVSGAMKTNGIMDDHEPSTNNCSLFGYKWFSSATDADMTLTLARFPATHDELKRNKGKISLVFMKIRKPSGELNNIEIVRLKDKFGTR